MPLRESRRNVMAALGLTPLIAGQAVATVGHAEGLTVYSPAPASHPMHALNLDLAAAVAASGGPAVQTIAVALPDSINRIAALPAEVRPYHLPIVTTVDFDMARQGLGPDWHRYDTPHPDLLFVSALYEVGFGLFVADPSITTPSNLRRRRIAVPPRPSSLRLLSEALLGQGWGVLDEVVLVDVPMQAAGDALATGAVDATTWNLILPSSAGHGPVFGMPGRFLDISDEVLAAIAAGGLSVRRADLGDASAGTMSFAQALAAWATTPAETVAGLVVAIERFLGTLPGLPGDRAGMLDWPGLAAEAIHPAAL